MSGYDNFEVKKQVVDRPRYMELSERPQAYPVPVINQELPDSPVYDHSGGQYPQHLFPQPPQSQVFMLDSEIEAEPSTIVRTEEEDWSLEWTQMCWQRLDPPKGDVTSVVACASVSYCCLIRADCLGLKMLPFITPDPFEVRCPSGHLLSMLATKRDLEMICDGVAIDLKQPLTKASRYTDISDEDSDFHSSRSVLAAISEQHRLVHVWEGGGKLLYHFRNHCPGRVEV